jgi:anti-anti-sigma regulatory factor
MNTADISNCFSTTIYQGKEEKYDILAIEKEKLNTATSPEIKAAFVKYFGEKKYRDQKITKHVVDMSKVTDIDYNGLAAILVGNRLSSNNGDGYISIIGCNNVVRRKFEISQIDTILQIVDDIYVLEQVNNLASHLPRI